MPTKQMARTAGGIPTHRLFDSQCDRCGWRGKVCPGGYGGYRCAVCFALQWGWMPCG